MGGRTHAEVIEQVPVSRLSLWPGNPRKGDVDLIAESIAVNGFYSVIVAQRSSGRVMVGNHRLLAARKVGLKEVPVVWADVDDDRAKRIVLVDNKSSDDASYETELLLELLGEFDVDDLTGTGWTQAEIERMITPPVLPDDEPEPVGMQLQIVVDCGSATQQAELLRKFEEEGLSAHARTV